MANVPKEWLIDEKNYVEERIKNLKQYMQSCKGNGYAPTIEFLSQYIDMIDKELAKP